MSKRLRKKTDTCSTLGDRVSNCEWSSMKMYHSSEHISIYRFRLFVANVHINKLWFLLCYFATRKKIKPVGDIWGVIESQVC